MALNNFKQALREHVTADANVSALIGTRMFPMTIPKHVIDDPDGLPVLVFSVDRTDYTDDLQGPFASDVAVRFTCFDRDLETIEDAIDKVIAALNIPRQEIGTTNPFQIQSGRVVNRQDVYNETVQLFGDEAVIEFNICE